MKFDPRKPHGTITNHPWARYEQDGVLFDVQGKTKDYVEIEEPDDENIEEEEVSPVNNNERDFSLENAKDFLRNILAEGGLPRSAIYKEVQANNQDWEKIKTAFSGMGGEKFYRRNVLCWKLKTE